MRSLDALWLQTFAGLMATAARCPGRIRSAGALAFH
jgi:hypothetical protein